MLSQSLAINLVVNCTGRKRAKSRAIAARRFKGISLEKRIKHWTTSLEESEAPSVPASELYCGDSWATIRSAILTSGPGHEIEWWIVSAGYGLIRSDELIVPYSATLTRRNRDSVMDPDEVASTGQQWWDGLCAWKRSRRRRPSSLQRLASMYPDRPLLVVLSADYVSALENDLLAAQQELTDPDRLVIVSAGAKKDGPLAANFLPCDARLEHALGGARSSLNARIARRILTTITPKKVCISNLRRTFVNLLRRQPPVRFIKRQRWDDGQLVGFIERGLTGSEGTSHSALLRALRDGGVACEQQRFRKLFNATKRAFLSRQ